MPGEYPSDSVIDQLSVIHRNNYRITIITDQRCMLKKFLGSIENQIDENGKSKAVNCEANKVVADAFRAAQAAAPTTARPPRFQRRTHSSVAMDPAELCTRLVFPFKLLWLVSSPPRMMKGSALS